ncbi:MAG: hypothetical protein RLZZ393_1913, partial [Pseudomonadota bacterium]
MSKLQITHALRRPATQLAATALLLALGGTASAADVSIELCATQGTMAAGAVPSMPILGFVEAVSCATAPALSAPGGPVLHANVGDTVTVTLHNGLASATGLLFSGQSLPTDLVGAAVAGSKTYTFTASKPGTYLYQAAPLRNAEHQVAMGLHGALVIRPADHVVATRSVTVTNGSAEVLDASAAAADVGRLASGTGIPAGARVASVMVGVSLTLDVPATADASSLTLSQRAAYGTDSAAEATTAYDEEAVLVLSEIDPALNTAANPSAFDMRDYAPKYFLINGKAYPDTTTITSIAGHDVLLRYVNAGARHHSMSLLGLRQRILGKDGNLLPTRDVALVAETLATGQSADALVHVPAAGRFAVYDAGLFLQNGSATGIGGMLTFVNAGSSGAASGPVATALSASPSPTNGSVASTLTATLTAPAGKTVQAAEYFIDAIGTAGAGLPLSGGFPGASVTASAVVAAADVAALSSGTHRLFVHGQDADGNWGAYGFAALNVDKAGPTTTINRLTPNPASTTSALSLGVTGDDTATGNGNVVAAEYSLDGAAAVALTAAGGVASTRSLSATISPPAGGFTTGSHTLTVRSQDALGNWGSAASANFTVQSVGPTATVSSVSQTPNNGTRSLTVSQPVVRVATSFVAGGAGTVVGAEGFIDQQPAAGTRGLPLVPADGQWNQATEAAYLDIPLPTVTGLSNGSHTVYVRGRDALGNWGAFASGTLYVDKTAPTVGAIALSPSNETVNTAVNFSAPASDASCAPAVCAVDKGEYYLDAIGAPGTGTAMTLSGGTLSASLTSARVAAL